MADRTAAERPARVDGLNVKAVSLSICGQSQSTVLAATEYSAPGAFLVFMKSSSDWPRMAAYT
jgi:hypothetical protein